MAQRFRSRYGRPGIQVPDLCPTRAIKGRLGRTHVGTSAAEVEAMIREAAADSRAHLVDGGGWTTKAENDAVRFALWQHEENRAEYAWVMGSH